MIFIPYSTDAPIYHWPVATVSIIVANVVIFFLTMFRVNLEMMDPESIEWLLLEFDQVNPVQWITGAFMHGDLSHLIGNMIFLWAFGLVVEGKIGSVKFAALYFLIASLDGASTQIPMYVLGSDGGALGASGVIFALMTIAVIWAPENEMECFYWVFLIFAGTKEFRIVALGCAYLFLQLFFLFLGGFRMSSELLHLVGAAIGAPIGFYMLRQGMVDCEGWDLVSRSFLIDHPLFATPEQRRLKQSKETEIVDPVSEALRLSSKNPKSPAGSARSSTAQARQRKTTKTQSSANAATDVAESSVNASEHPEFNRLSYILRQALQAKNSPTAMQTFHQLDKMQLTAGLSNRTLFQFVGLLGSERKYTEALHPLGLIVGRGGAEADKARLKIAMIQLKVLNKPQLAITVLRSIEGDPEADPEILKKRDQLLAQAQPS
ncbi:MAG: rhomboid family intramembrane serine protease [Planctomycetota bacterium]